MTSDLFRVAALWQILVVGSDIVALELLVTATEVALFPVLALWWPGVVLVLCLLALLLGGLLLELFGAVLGGLLSGFVLCSYQSMSLSGEHMCLLRCSVIFSALFESSEVVGAASTAVVASWFAVSLAVWSFEIEVADGSGST